MAQAKQFDVTTTTDTADPNLLDNSCDIDLGTMAVECSLRSAVQQANNNATNDVIKVPAGTYTLTLNGSGEDAAATGDLDVTQAVTIERAGAGTVTVSASGLTTADRVFHVFGANVTLRQMTVTAGSAANGGGIAKSGNNTLTLSQMVVSGNTATNGGGVHVSSPSTVAIGQSTVSGNHADDNGGGLFADDGAVVQVGNSTTFSANDADLAGGGLYCEFLADVSVDDALFDGNSTLDDGFGGGIACLEADLHITDTEFTENDSGTGGGLYVDGNADAFAEMRIDGSLFDGNIARADTPGGGGGIYATDGDFRMSDTELTGNSATDGDGGGVYADVKGSGSLGMVLTTVRLHDNTASSGVGGGIRWALTGVGSAARMDHSAIYDNDALDSAGVYATLNEDADLTLSRNTVSGNSATQYAGGMWLNADVGAIVAMDHLTVAFNTAVADGGGIYLFDDAGDYGIEESIVSNNDADPDMDPFTGTFPDCGGDNGAEFTSGGNNIIMDSCGDGTECPGFENFGALANGDQVGGVDTGDPMLPITWICPGTLALGAGSAFAGGNVLADPELDTLQDNGGNTMTHEIPDAMAFTGLLGLAHENGASCAPDDQRGLTAPVGDCDIGAFERQ